MSEPQAKRILNRIESALASPTEQQEQKRDWYKWWDEQTASWYKQSRIQYREWMVRTLINMDIAAAHPSAVEESELLKLVEKWRKLQERYFDNGDEWDNQYADGMGDATEVCADELAALLSRRGR